MNLQLQDQESNEDSDVAFAILQTFYANDSRNWIECINEFNVLMAKEIHYNIKLDLNFKNKPAEYYIIADTYLGKADLVALYNHLSGKSVSGITIQLAKQVKDEFLQSVAYLKDMYEWIYNPPMIGNIGKYTPGKRLRQDFQDHYGAYAEITYLLSKGDALKFDEVNKMPLHEYLALGEYLLRKRAVESVD